MSFLIRQICAFVCLDILIIRKIYCHLRCAAMHATTVCCCYMNAAENQHTTSFWQVARNSSHTFTTVHNKIYIVNRKRWYFNVLFCIIHTNIQLWIKFIPVTLALEEILSTSGSSQVATKRSGPSDETVVTEILCHRMCGTKKKSLFAKTVNVEQNPAPETLTSLYEWNMVEREKISNVLPINQ